MSGFSSEQAMFEAAARIELATKDGKDPASELVEVVDVHLEKNAAEAAARQEIPTVGTPVETRKNELLQQMQSLVRESEQFFSQENEDLRALVNSFGFLLENISQSTRIYSDAQELSEMLNSLYARVREEGQEIVAVSRLLEVHGNTRAAISTALEVSLDTIGQLRVFVNHFEDEAEPFTSRLYSWAQDHGDLIGYSADEIAAHAQSIRGRIENFKVECTRMRNKWDSLLGEFADHYSGTQV